MRALIYRCFVCGKIATVVTNEERGRVVPPPPGWNMVNVFAQSQETGITVQVSVPVCLSPCQRPHDRFLNMVLPTVEYMMLGTVVQSAPCRIEVVAVEDGTKPPPS